MDCILEIGKKKYLIGKIDYDENQNEQEREMAPRIELDEQKDMQKFDVDSEKNKNEEAADSKRNCILDV